MDLESSLVALETCLKSSALCQCAPKKERFKIPKDTLCKDQIDNEEKKDSSCDEYLRCDCDRSIGRMGAPDQAHRARRDPSHTETEHQAGYEKLLSSFILI